MIIEIEKSYLDDLKYKIRNLQIKCEDYENTISRLETEKESLAFKIKTELEPRIESEKRSYDAYITTDHAAEAGESFCETIDSLIDSVKENPNYYVWDDPEGDLYEQILSLIKRSVDK